MQKSLNWTIRAVLAASLVLAVASCGKKNEKAGTKEQATTHTAQVPSVSLDNLAIAKAVKDAGYETVFYRNFPAQVPGMKAFVLVYRHGSSGGVLYLQKYGDDERPVWHWYFPDGAPDSVAAVEINEDGLWDVRMFAGNKTMDYVQDQAFTFVAPPRDDRVAMNGETSEPVAADGMLWHAFDDDSTTAWRSNAKGAYVDLPVPLGLDAGILTVQLLADNQPKTIEVSADGKKIKDFDLEATTNAQAIQLGDQAMGAKMLRLDIKSTRDDAGAVAISELGAR